MTIKEKIKEIKSSDFKEPQIYVCSKSKLYSHKYKANEERELCYLYFTFRNFAKDKSLELDKELIGVELDKAEFSSFSLDLRETESGFINVYYLYVNKLSRNNKGTSRHIGEVLIKPKKKLRIEL